MNSEFPLFLKLVVFLKLLSQNCLWIISLLSRFSFVLKKKLGDNSSGISGMFHRHCILVVGLLLGWLEVRQGYLSLQLSLYYWNRQRECCKVQSTRLNSIQVQHSVDQALRLNGSCLWAKCLTVPWKKQVLLYFYFPHIAFFLLFGNPATALWELNDFYLDFSLIYST